MTRDEILATVRRHDAALRELHVRELSLFGSYARGDAGEGSDLDFLVELERKSFDDYMAVRELLERLFGRKVDLVMKSALKQGLRERILAEAIRAA